MSVIEEAKQAILHLAALTAGFRTGSPPDPYSLLAIQSDLVRLHLQLGVEMSQAYRNLGAAVDELEKEALKRRPMEDRRSPLPK